MSKQAHSVAGGAGNALRVLPAAPRILAYSLDALLEVGDVVEARLQRWVDHD
jgi:hypothetical protein